jgi:hypothetical protein
MSKTKADKTKWHDKFKVGDLVYCFGFGWGTVTDVDLSNYESHPITVRVRDQGIVFTRDCKRHDADPLPSLLTEKEAVSHFLDNPPPSRKRLVTMAPVVYLPFELNTHSISQELFSTLEDAKHCYGKHLVTWLIDTPYAIQVEVDE